MRSILDTLTMKWDGHALHLLDQRKLPTEVTYIRCQSHEDVSRAIGDMVVRGAPAIGAAAAFGYVLGAMRFAESRSGDVTKAMATVRSTLSASRPTAVNLFWALKRMHLFFESRNTKPQWLSELEREAITIAEEDISTNRRIGELGASLLSDQSNVITHCNAGALATVGYGTALGVIRDAKDQGKAVHVFVDETRPYLQGARLTAWELINDGIDCTLISDNMAGWVMKKKGINAVVVGADRITTNGDAANKIGSYSLAVLAAFHKIPFYVVAPSSTIDLELLSGEEIPIEERSSEEITHISGIRIAPENVSCFNPAFDVIPASLITAIVTEDAVNYPPYHFRSTSGKHH